MAPAMASVSGLVLAVMLSLNFQSSSAVVTWLGGSSAIAPLVNNIVTNFNARFPRSKIPPGYTSSNSAAGKLGLKKGTFYVGVSTTPFSTKEEAGFRKLTIPQSALTISFFTQSKKNIRLTPGQIAKIHTGAIRTWQQIRGSGLKGKIVLFARSDAAGVTQTYTQFLKLALRSAWPSKFTGEGPFSFGNPNIRYVKGAAAIAAGIKATKGSLGAVQSGVGAKTYGLAEVLLLNHAGKYVSITAANPADPLQALPRSPPAATASWNGVYLSWGLGVKTFPIVTLAYFFYKPSYPRKVGTIVKTFAKFTQSAAGQKLASNYYFYALPTSFTKAGTKAANSIKLT